MESTGLRSTAPHDTIDEESLMDGTADDIKGRAKEAAGALTDDKDLKNEGKTDQAAGKAKNVVGDIKDKAEDVVDNVKDKLHRD